MENDRVDQIWEGVLGDGIEGDFWEEGLPSCVQSKLECLRGWSVHNLLWQFVSVRDYSKTERMLAATGFTSLLRNFEGVTWKPNAAQTTSHGKSRRSCIILYTQIRSPRILLWTRENSRSRWRTVLYGTWRSPFTNFPANFEHFLAPGNPGREWGRMLILQTNKRFVQGEENTRRQGCEGLL